MWSCTTSRPAQARLWSCCTASRSSGSTCQRRLSPVIGLATMPGMLPSSYEHQNCPIASGLEVVGERWTLLILRDAFLGVRRFDDFQADLGMSRTVLAGRLDALVDAGLLRREAYQRRPVR